MPSTSNGPSSYICSRCPGIVQFVTPRREDDVRATAADGLSQRFPSLSTITNRQQSTEDPGGNTLDCTHDAVVANTGEVADDIHHVALPAAVLFERNPPR